MREELTNRGQHHHVLDLVAVEQLWESAESTGADHSTRLPQGCCQTVAVACSQTAQSRPAI